MKPQPLDDKNDWGTIINSRSADFNTDMFINMDTDGNGCVTWNEIRAYLGIENDADDIIRDMAENHFAKADVDRSGCVTRKEAMDWKNQEENDKTGQDISVDVKVKITKRETPQGSALLGALRGFRGS